MQKPKRVVAERRAATPPDTMEVFKCPDGGGPRFVVPLLGTIRNCEPTDFGWRGVMPDGVTVEVRPQRPGSRA